jgi:hypothetical protein
VPVSALIVFVHQSISSGLVTAPVLTHAGPPLLKHTAAAWVVLPSTRFVIASPPGAWS